mmetsp:Transcript_6977/g.21397  ORF Transcript_6977/g.21397 Transcript_6977/m.21397 type:complete len:209 (+) Transcript_6977:394-1020(+)|eukprot:scaffold122884_cov28-Tisochrysis_lutea.AAC.3
MAARMSFRVMIPTTADAESNTTSCRRPMVWKSRHTRYKRRFSFTVYGVLSMSGRKSILSSSSSASRDGCRGGGDSRDHVFPRLASSTKLRATSPLLPALCRLIFCSSRRSSFERVISPAKQHTCGRSSASSPSVLDERRVVACTELTTGKPLWVVERSSSRTEPTVASVSCKICTLVAIMDLAERIQFSASAVEVAVDRSNVAPPSSI